MVRLRDAMVTTETLSTLDSHGPYMSDADEAEIMRRLGASDDVADLAVRTCMCGRRLDGFDEYFEHLRAVIREGLASP
jgi:hypothetical protein